MNSAIVKIDRRINDLSTFDLLKVRRSFDPVIEALENKVNGTLQNILGPDTIQYETYSVDLVNSISFSWGDESEDLSFIRKYYAESIDQAVMRLTTLKELFEENIVPG